ncbi:helix-turn-helix transcriptional regulator [Kineosporia babensis]
MAVERQNEIRQFLTSRRSRLTPEQAGLPDFGGRRRVPGLRREEVALLAGMSREYYVRLERGNAAGVSEVILEGLSRALQLDAAERAHLYDLARVTSKNSAPTRPQAVRPIVQQLLDGMPEVPAFVQNSRLDVLATNQLAAALLAPVLGQSPANLARFTFLDPSAPVFYRNWSDLAAQKAALLHAETGRSPHDSELTRLIGELCAGSANFRRLWAAHDVREHQACDTHLQHPVVGDLALTCEGMELTNDRGLFVIVYAPTDPASSDRLLRLGESYLTAPATSPAT